MAWFFVVLLLSAGFQISQQFPDRDSCEQARAKLEEVRVFNGRAVDHTRPCLPEHPEKLQGVTAMR
jgi:hypothetical protein